MKKYQCLCLYMRALQSARASLRQTLLINGGVMGYTVQRLQWFGFASKQEK
jgi:hypothetical protein